MPEKGFEPKKGWLTGRAIPLNSAGDPAFTELGCEQFNWVKTESGPVWDPEGWETVPLGVGAVLSQFSPEEVVYLVNKALYALAYQREHHKKRAAAEREALAPIKEKVKSLFGVSYLKATDEQLQSAAKAVAAEKESDGR